MKGKKGIIVADSMVECERCDQIIAEALFIIETNATLRQAEKRFGVSRSTINRDIALRLPRIDAELAKKANSVLQSNKAKNRANIVDIRKSFLDQRR